MFKLTIKTDNAAFEPSKEAEVERILLKLVNSAAFLHDDNGKLRDVNGNTVGEWSFS